MKFITNNIKGEHYLTDDLFTVVEQFDIFKKSKVFGKTKIRNAHKERDAIYFDFEFKKPYSIERHTVAYLKLVKDFPKFHLVPKHKYQVLTKGKQISSYLLQHNKKTVSNELLRFLESIKKRPHIEVCGNDMIYYKYDTLVKDFDSFLDEARKVKDILDDNP
jgi:hypothetical protein